MKGELTLKILEFLEEGITTGIDLAAALSTGGSMAKVQREFGRRHFRRSSNVEKLRESVKKRNNFCKLLCKLKREGFIVENKKSRLLGLTSRGKRKIDVLRRRLEENLPSSVYPKENGDKLKIIIFDIPENQRRKRNWLRSVLANLGFTMLQKSVWLGQNKIPEDLLEDLEKLELLPFVEIFEIGQTGSIKLVSKK